MTESQHLIMKLPPHICKYTPNSFVCFRVDYVQKTKTQSQKVRNWYWILSLGNDTRHRSHTGQNGFRFASWELLYGLKHENRRRRLSEIQSVSATETGRTNHRSIWSKLLLSKYQQNVDFRPQNRYFRIFPDLYYGFLTWSIYLWHFESN